MAVVYTVASKLEFNLVNPSNGILDMVDSVSVMLTELAAGWIFGNVSRFDIQITVDNETFSISKPDSLECCKDKVSKLNQAMEKIDISLFYEYQRWDMVNPERLVNMYHEILKEYGYENIDEQLEKEMFFSYYIDNADNDETCGNLYAYGYKNGILHDGEMAFHEVSDMPTGNWQSVHEVAIVDKKLSDYKEKPGFEDMISLMSQIKDLGVDSCSVSGEFLCLYMYDISIDNEEKLKRLVDISSRLRTWFEHQGIGFYFIDYEANCMRMMRVMVGLDGKYKMEIAEI